MPQTKLWTNAINNERKRMITTLLYANFSKVLKNEINVFEKIGWNIEFRALIQ